MRSNSTKRCCLQSWTMCTLVDSAPSSSIVNVSASRMRCQRRRRRSGLPSTQTSINSEISASCSTKVPFFRASLQRTSNCGVHFGFATMPRRCHLRRLRRTTFFERTCDGLRFCMVVVDSSLQFWMREHTFGPSNLRMLQARACCCDVSRSYGMKRTSLFALHRVSTHSRVQVCKCKCTVRSNCTWGPGVNIIPVKLKLRAICEVSDEWEKLGRIRHQRTT